MVDLRSLGRRLYVPLVRRMPVVSLGLLALRGRESRNSASFVRGLYEAHWGEYEARLDVAADLEAWLSIPGFDDTPDTVLDAGRVRYTRLDHVRFLGKTMAEAIREAFPSARTAAEFGSGVGRTLLAVERERPDLQLVGYELAEAGVAVARRAAAKFESRTRYARLDYARDPESAWTFGTTDVAFTVYSLAEVPELAPRALASMLAHVKEGLVLLEASPARYPLTPRGMLGRAYARQRGYLWDLERALREAGARDVSVRSLVTSNNPMLLPSLFVVRKSR